MANKKIINKQFAQKLAQVLFSVFEDNTMTFVIGKDTREYAFDIEQTLTQGLKSLGANVFLLGVTSTSAISFATRAYKATCGIMITGGLKPKEFIGFKIFNGNGFKITDEQISQVSYRYKNLSEINPKRHEGTVYFKPYFNDEYIKFLKQFTMFNSKNSLKILADCSCGSAEELYEEFCASVGIVPFLASGGCDNENINSHYLKALKTRKVQKFKKYDYDKPEIVIKDFFDYKIIFSGDCDRLLIFDRNGEKISNDLLFALFCLDEKNNHEDFIACTNLYTNQSIFDFLTENKIQYILSPSSITEKQLVQTLLANNGNFAGDKFGSFVFMEIEKTSSAFLTLIKFLNIVTKKPELIKQVLSVKLIDSEEKDYKISSEINFDDFNQLILSFESMLENSGKILVRQDKLIKRIYIYIESNDKQLRLKIFNDIEKYFKNLENKKN